LRAAGDLHAPTRAVRQAATRLHRHISDAQPVCGGHLDSAHRIEAAVGPDGRDCLHEAVAVDAGSRHGDVVEDRAVIDEMDVLESARVS
jgi:hypothetical protein